MLKDKPNPMISFMSEHTVEYSLAGDIVNRLRPAFPDLVPIYLWLNREGNTMGRRAFGEKEFRLVAVFPRRPKVTSPQDDHVLVKFNRSVLRYGYEARAYGIPVLAGVPLVSDLSEYRINSTCAWFLVNGLENDDTYLELIMTKHADVVRRVGPTSAVRGPVKAADIIEDLQNVGTRRIWDHWLDSIRQLQADSEPDVRRYFWFGARYKPFYLAAL